MARGERRSFLAKAPDNVVMWIKQNLKIKSFLGTMENAVLSQIWVLHRLFEETLLDRIPLVDLLNLSGPRLIRLKRLDPQLHFSFIAT